MRDASPGLSSTEPSWQRIAAGAIGILALAALWPLLRPYDWLSRDAQLYALQAFSNARPGLFTNDLFFLFGSQDRFTVLTSLVAPLYGRWGVEQASAFLTVCGNALWWASCFWLARTLAGERLAWFSLAVAMATPGWYGGGGDVFRFAESYFGARLPAEALVMAALACEISRRPRAAIALLAAALFVHPLMTASGAAMILMLRTPTRRWPQLLVLALVGVGCLLLLARLHAVGRIAVVDHDWLRVIAARSPYLFVSSWTELDWFRGAATLTLLVAAAQWLSEPTARRVALAAAIIGAGGVLVTWLACDVVPVAFVIQAQPWRTLWLATVISLLVAPVAVIGAWRSTSLGPASALFMATAVCSLSPIAGFAASAAALACGLARTAPSNSSVRLVTSTAGLALAATLLVNVFGIVDVLQIPVFGGGGDPRLEQVRNVFAFVVPPLVLAAGLAYLISLRRSASSLVVAACVTGALVLFVGRPAIGEFRETAYAGQKFALFADWRQRIPEGTNVFWPRSPMGAWFLLERPSYLSISQLSGVVFSRELAIESAARAARVSGYVSPAWIFADPDYVGEGVRALTLPILRDVCAVPEIGFVVASEQVTDSAPWHEWPDPSHRVYLYDCAEFR